MSVCFQKISRTDGWISKIFFAMCRYTQQFLMLRFSSASLARFARAPLFSFFRYLAIVKVPFHKSRERVDGFQKFFLLYVGIHCTRVWFQCWCMCFARAVGARSSFFVFSLFGYSKSAIPQISRTGGWISKIFSAVCRYTLYEGLV